MNTAWVNAEPLHGLDEWHRMGMELIRLHPDVPSLGWLALLPDDFAQVRADLTIGRTTLGPGEQFIRALKFSIAIIGPAQAIRIGGASGLNRQGPLD